MGQWLRNIKHKSRKKSRRPKVVPTIGTDGKAIGAMPGSFFNPLGVTRVETEGKVE